MRWMWWSKPQHICGSVDPPSCKCDIPCDSDGLFLKGHTENEADTVHSTIERAKNDKKVYLPSEWPVVLQNTPTERFDIITHTLNFSSFYDMKEMQKTYRNFRINEEGETALNWFNVRVIKVRKGSSNLWFKNNYGDDVYKHVNLMQVGKGRRMEDKVYEIPKLINAYDSPIPIKRAKYDDLIDLCSGDEPVIPSRHHRFYRNIVHDE